MEYPKPIGNLQPHFRRQPYPSLTHHRDVMKRAYRRHLPHQIPENTPIFVTFCLKGAIPKRLRLRMESERQRLQSQPRQ
jgi:hypothetical protein